MKYNNGFSHLELQFDVKKSFTKTSNEDFQYSIVWVTKGMIDLQIDDIIVSLGQDQMAFITPLDHVIVRECHGEATILKFNREFYCIRENDFEISCEGFLFFGTERVSILNLMPTEIVSFDRLVHVLIEEFEVVDTIQEEMLRIVLKKWLIKATRLLKDDQQIHHHDRGKIETFVNS